MPVFSIMDTAIISGVSHATEISESELEAWWTAGDDVRYLKFQTSQMKKNGTEDDISSIPSLPTNWRYKEQPDNKRKRDLKIVNRLWPRRHTDTLEPFSTIASVATSATHHTTSNPPSRPESPFEDDIIFAMESFDGDSSDVSNIYINIVLLLHINF